MLPTSDLHVVETRPLVAPVILQSDLPLTERATHTVQATRQRIKRILSGEDQRLLVIVGPCSVHDLGAAEEYAGALVQIRERLQAKLEIVMRVYFEKPRTTIGWKGLINDPHLDGSYDINTGLRKARGLLLYLAERGLPAATELLDPVVPQYIADLISWTAIGARTTESQTHREMASGLSMPIGYKNGTDGSVTIAINAMEAASRPHHFLGINRQGHAAIVSTTGNPDGHLVLRGGGSGTNYHPEAIAAAAEALQKADLPHRVMVDCSHGNSNKDYRRQAEVLEAVAGQVQQGGTAVMGVMLESHLVAGSQKIPADLSQLTYGQSITDACIDLDTTEALLEKLAAAVA
ncbi:MULTISPECIES: 3-deoxy-7-phosphoheptulonate synthase [Synechococcus]|jgi:3-deoxy-7-phosphoheptulonate synthase|uniref:Phospho-2-dehydro-3-deoxyheptonate aldolase n=2 Tax=Synechococcus TaxID=1129 RepID=A0A2P7ECY9_9SYNE|nr:MULTISPECIES: 3-deoxy-7-phosphoheptulonate synthase [Synechococcus]NBV69768.1 3-deoxy-7-phosphoheptulonate synthase [Synechococcaceae bacterium WB4_2_0805]NDA75049.1 3-deoxy-7-phosphoheptulonate synthase [Synechococcaceae bacterium WB8_3_299]HBU25944.1 3-deoxy-7-phosphoheptulonate synthase [Synechococcales bacterium UBA8138]MCP9795107.1 3-deoxy-7-phosphoheptulonate synthase [Synechococcus lacustris L1F-Slac]MCP9810949.1 3-deoxy-7-phosphoheptulonate synthase [Synechococcus lacustris Maggiore